MSLQNSLSMMDIMLSLQTINQVMTNDAEHVNITLRNMLRVLSRVLLLQLLVYLDGRDTEAISAYANMYMDTDFTD